MTTHPTQDSHGRPIRPVYGRSGQLLGFARNDARREGELQSRTGAMSPTPDGAYPREPMARPLTEAERAELAPLSLDHARDTLEAHGLDPDAAEPEPAHSEDCSSLTCGDGRVGCRAEPEPEPRACGVLLWDMDEPAAVCVMPAGYDHGHAGSADELVTDGQAVYLPRGLRWRLTADPVPCYVDGIEHPHE